MALTNVSSTVHYLKSLVKTDNTEENMTMTTTSNCSAYQLKLNDSTD